MMRAVVVEFQSVDESCCTETTARSNRFVPAEILYRSSISGAMLQALLFSRGINYSAEFNNTLNAAQDSIQGLSIWYRNLINELPSVAVTDGLLLRESRLRSEVFNSIYRGTATALGSIKHEPLRIADECHHLELNKNGKPTLTFRRTRTQQSPIQTRCAFCARPLEIDLGLKPLDFTVLLPDYNKNSLFPSLREVMKARVKGNSHVFRVPGARWRVVFLGKADDDLQLALHLFECVITDLGMGSKHAFRGKGSLLGSPRWIDLEAVTEPIEAPLFQSLICRDGDVTRSLESLGLSPTGGMSLTLRTREPGPNARIVPAVNGLMKASQGYLLRLDGGVYLVTEEDLKWPRPLSN